MARIRLRYSLLLFAVLTSCTRVVTQDPREILASDSETAAGRMEGNVLTVALEARKGWWQPDGTGGHKLDGLAAFAEAGKGLTTPGPLLRVPVGTTVRGSLHNTLPRAMTVFGLGKSRTPGDSLHVAAGATTQFEFTADHPGTYYYYAQTGRDTLGTRLPEDMQLHGVLVVDSAGTPPDHIVAISWYVTANAASPTGLARTAMALNGRAWPHTQRLHYAQHDSVRWRVVNFTEIDHPMHLHGFFFRVNSKSDGMTDTIYSHDQQRMAVTEMMLPFQTMSIAWLADRPGNWVFHCHYALHIGGLVSLDTKDGVEDTVAPAHHSADVPHHMAGLVMGITVDPKGPQVAAAPISRRIRLEQREHPNTYGKHVGMSYVMNGTREADDPALMSIPAPVIVLERGKRVEVTVVNKSSMPAAVHWHGIELESYPDGIPGWSGAGTHVLPMIAAHDSLSVAWTPPRAGSFMYHSHMMEAMQMGAGLYGPLIVLDSGVTYDPETDRTLFFGTAGKVENVFGKPPALLLNGNASPEPMNFKAGVTYRLRLFNLAGDLPTKVALLRDGKPAEWRAVAKDGYPLPDVQAVRRSAVLVFDPGEIYDYEFTPARSGTYRLTFGIPQFPGSPPPPPPTEVVMRVM